MSWKSVEYILKQEAQLLLGKADHTAYVWSPVTPISSHWEKAIWQKWDSSMHTMLTKRCLESFANITDIARGHFAQIAIVPCMWSFRHVI